MGSMTTKGYSFLYLLLFPPPPFGVSTTVFAQKTWCSFLHDVDASFVPTEQPLLYVCRSNNKTSYSKKIRFSSTGRRVDFAG